MVETLYSFKNLRKYHNNPCVIWKEFDGSESIYFYEDIVVAAEKLVAVFGKIGVKKCSKIVVNIGHNAILFPVMLGILNNSCCYCPVNLEEHQIKECMARYQVRYYISDVPISTSNQPAVKANVLNDICYIYTFDFEENYVDLKPDVLCYAIQTSGTTGQPKIVNVPYSCILPNIIHLSNLFSISTVDAIFVSSPPTFDPFIVDVFMAFMHGSALIIVPTSLRLSPSKLATLIFRSGNHNATICQMTPSLFRLFDKHSLEQYVFHDDSSLRYLILGGEPFPQKSEFAQWPIWRNAQKVKIYNIYGITEVSCWTSIAEVKFKKEDVPLGSSLDYETRLIVRNVAPPHELITEGNGELCIESTSRKCFIDFEDPMTLVGDKLLSRRTGDLVELKDSKIYYKGRTDAFVKRFGCKINLKAIEDKIKLAHPSIWDVCCVFDKEKSILIAFVTLNRQSIQPTFGQLSKCLNKIEVPDDVVALEKFPLSCHGKVSKLKLLDFYRSEQENNAIKNDNSVEKVFRNKLKQYLDVQITPGTSETLYFPTVKRLRRESFEELSFVDAGGTSFIALSLVSELEDITCKSFGNIFIKLLDKSQTIRQVIEELKESSKNCAMTLPHELKNSSSADIQLKIIWKFNLNKCIDASPTLAQELDREIVAVGSHSHNLVCLDILNGSEIAMLKLPDRIEGQIVVVEEHGIVGCYDGFLYKFVLATGEIIHKFDSNGMIKSRPLVSNGLIFFGNYSTEENVFCLDYKTFSKNWSTRVGSKSCIASPIALDNTSMIVCTLDGTVACVNYASGKTVWDIQFSAPIFATPCKLSITMLCVAEVCGSIHCIENGTKVCTYTLTASVFSSLLTNSPSRVIFGCYDHKIYSLIYSDVNRQLSMEWNVQLDAQIYSTPAYLQLDDESYLVASTTKGNVNLIDMKKPGIVQSIQLGGEIFSSPTVTSNKILIGCRDNYLYCIEVQKMVGDRRFK